MNNDFFTLSSLNKYFFGSFDKTEMEHISRYVTDFLQGNQDKSLPYVFDIEMTIKEQTSMKEIQSVKFQYYMGQGSYNLSCQFLERFFHSRNSDDSLPYFVECKIQGRENNLRQSAEKNTSSSVEIHEDYAYDEEKKKKEEEEKRQKEEKKKKEEEKKKENEKVESSSIPKKESIMRGSDLEYKKLLEERIKCTEKSLSELRGKKHTELTEIRIKSLEIELEKLKKNYQNFIGREEFNKLFEAELSLIDASREKNNEGKNEYQKKIDELEAMKKELKGFRSKKVVDGKIHYFERRLRSLQKKDAFCGKVQRTIMYPKYRYEMRKIHLLSYAEGRVENYKTSLAENEELKEMLKRDEFKWNLFDKFKSNIRGSYYKKNLAKSQALLQEMQKKDTVIGMYGARATSWMKTPTVVAAK